MTAPERLWWTAAEIAAAGFPGVPGSRQGVEHLAKVEGWRGQTDLARPSEGRGGGWQYNWQLLPRSARRMLLTAAKAAPETAPAATHAERDEVWAWFEGLKDGVKAKAEARLRVLQAVETQIGTGFTMQDAVASVAAAEGIGPRSLWRWHQMIQGVERADWLAYLAPRHGGSTRKAKSKIHPEFYNAFKAFYLRLERPALTDCYRQAIKLAKSEGWPTVSVDILRRRLNADVPRTFQVFAREGVAAFERCFAPQIRDRSGFVAMDMVNADFHKFDVFVVWPGFEKPQRPQVVAFQDLYSGKILSWKVDLMPNAVATMSAFGAMVERYGIPRHCLFDNGMEFAAKSLTGGAKTRRRFKIRDDEPEGILTLLGVKVHWATTGYGQAKPVERAFGDWARSIAKDPRFHGAYVGHKPDAKPENYGSKAIPQEEFLRVVAEGIAAHNARTGRRSHTAKGRSFDETFQASYEVEKITKATPDQRRLWLMAHAERTLDKINGRLKLLDNFYYSPWMSEHAGARVVVRFDPQDLQESAVYIYTPAGELLGTALCQARTGFLDLAAAREHAAEKSKRKRAARKALEEASPTKLSDAAARLTAAAARNTAEEPLSAKVIEGAFGTRVGKSGARTVTHAPLPPTPIDTAREAAEIEDFEARYRARTPAPSQDDKEEAQFEWAKRVEAALARDVAVGEDELERLRAYQGTAEYRALSLIHQAATENSAG